MSEEERSEQIIGREVSRLVSEKRELISALRMLTEVRSETGEPITEVTVRKVLSFSLAEQIFSNTKNE